MGGRGSSGGSGGSGGSVRMPTLTGSEKQVSWATDIRDTALSNADLIVKNAERGRQIGISTGPTGRNISVEAARTVRAEVRDTLAATTSASTLINNRDRLSFNTLSRLAEEETATGAVSEARRRRRQR